MKNDSCLTAPVGLAVTLIKWKIYSDRKFVTPFKISHWQGVIYYYNILQISHDIPPPQCSFYMKGFTGVAIVTAIRQMLLNVYSLGQLLQLNKANKTQYECYPSGTRCRMGKGIIYAAVFNFVSEYDIGAVWTTKRRRLKWKGYYWRYWSVKLIFIRFKPAIISQETSYYFIF